jgi:hypothetical protein
MDDFTIRDSAAVPAPLADPDATEAATRLAHRQALEPVRGVLAEAGFYAYGTLDDQGRWTVAADDEAGHIDVRVGADGFAIELWGTSPGLHADEENEFRRRMLERLVRMNLPAINRGLLEPHQSAAWDDAEGGVRVHLTYELPFTRREDIGDFVRDRLGELEETIAFVESRVIS